MWYNPETVLFSPLVRLIHKVVVGIARALQYFALLLNSKEASQRISSDGRLAASP